MRRQSNTRRYALIVCIWIVSAAAHCADAAAQGAVTGAAFATGVECGSDFGLARVDDPIDVGAMNRLGIKYARGRGVAKNYVIAVRWFRRSARAGYPPAMANLGTMYQQGKGLHRSYAKAYLWVRIALAFGVPAEDHDAMVFRLGLIASHLSRPGIARATQLAKSMAERLAMQESEPLLGPTASLDWTHEK